MTPPGPAEPGATRSTALGPAEPDVTRSAPGKLYIAGEYAVVEPGHRAVLVAVDRFITVRASPAEGSGRISSDLYRTGPLTWRRRPEDGAVQVPGRSGDYVVSAIRAVERMVREAGGTPRFFDLDISSELDGAGGRKLGLGSSSAVTVAAVRAVAGLYGLSLDDTAVYKLAMLASDAVQPIGSGGDIAAAAFTGWVGYASPDRAWLRRARTRMSAGELVRADWPGLVIRRLPAPGLDLRAGWTGAPASTPRLVAGVRAGAHGDDAAYADFLRGSEACLDCLMRAIEEDDSRGVMDLIGQSRRLLLGLARTSGITIETPQLGRLVDIAREHGAAAKSSGAGGGDCGIALCPPTVDAPAMCAAWEAAGIAPLDLAVHSRPEGRLINRPAGSTGPAFPVRSDPAAAPADPARFTGPAESERASRKDEHLELAMRLHGTDRPNAFDDVAFVHHALPGTGTEAVDTGTTVCGARWPVPFYINAMTGGTRATAAVNADLAGAAADAGVAIACGSQHIALRDPERAEGFRVIRREAPNAFVLANVGPTLAPEQAVRAVEMLRADALQIHLNAAQELVMPEGDRDFRGWTERIAAIVAAVDVPVVVKEVGFGLSRRTIAELERTGVGAVDVAGAGGTDFIAIENERRPRRDYSYLTGWGQSTALCLLEALGGGEPVGLPVLASGGVRHPLDVVRALALGADAVGVSGHFLRTLVETGADGLRRELRTWTDHVRTLMTLLGASDVEQLRRTDVLVTGRTAEQARLLGVDPGRLARRSARCTSMTLGATSTDAAGSAPHACTDDAHTHS